MAITLTGLHTHPVKSMRGVAHTEALVEPWGLAGDRRWMVVDASGECVTARQHPRMLLLTPQLTDGGVRLEGPGLAPLDVAAGATGDTAVSVHGNKHQSSAPLLASDAGDEAAAWLSAYLGLGVRLVFADDPGRRRLNPHFARETDSAAFADAYPILLTTLDSLAQLNGWIAAGQRPDEGPLPMRRFRPNLVVSGAAPFGEDAWRRIRIGNAIFRTPKGCDRCVMTTTDPDTAARGKEPIATLARHRRWDGATWFGMNLVPDNPGVVLRVGDEVEVLETAESDGPPR
jgi:hypothetical protein